MSEGSGDNGRARPPEGTSAGGGATRRPRTRHPRGAQAERSTGAQAKTPQSARAPEDRTPRSDRGERSAARKPDGPRPVRDSGERQRRDGAPQRGRNTGPDNEKRRGRQGNTRRHPPGQARRDAPSGPPITSARELALDLLHRVLDQGKPLDDAFHNHPALARIAPRDRAFARLLTVSVLRHLGQLDKVLDAFLRNRPAGRVHNILRLGAAQMLCLDTPPHAAVDEAVTVTDERLSGMVNAVLRRVDREGRVPFREQDGVRLNTPDWLWTRWAQIYGREAGRRVAEASLRPAPLDLTAKTSRVDAERLGAERLANGTLRVRDATGLIEQLPGYYEGVWWVQDAAAAVPVRLLGDIKGKRVLDLCAAPGGKTLQLAALGAEVTAVDWNDRRLERLQGNLGRCALKATIRTGNVLEWQPVETYPFILLDAPCSATGTIRRHPDILWQKKQAEVDKLAAIQKQMLKRALSWLAPGGTLIYATCSLQTEEGEHVVQAVLDEVPEITRVPIKQVEGQGVPLRLSKLGEARSLPFDWAEKGGLDGFFISRLHKQA